MHRLQVVLLDCLSWSGEVFLLRGRARWSRSRITGAQFCWRF